ncbi:E3 ubiquitin-protein ligase TRIP12-like [Diaphorina citri]|uniref:E3 ubiquitin-protein ligase n=1 Tax=Diaphorina citri TaxID=121845 RepID=A0A3Q0IZU8_DIACI|nr:E3 ubiquitin-protein ligase TRIP12-like [Diaphorina citri]
MFWGPFTKFYQVALHLAHASVSDESDDIIQDFKLFHNDESLTALTDLRDIVMTSDISPFEVNHSGLVRSLLGYLTRVTSSSSATDGSEERQCRLRKFLHVFAKCPLESNVIVEHKDCSAEPLAALIAKLNGCVSQLEQLPVKVHDLPAGTGSTTALKFFNTHQLKCHLQRHPSCTSLKQWKGGTVKIDPLARMCNTHQLKCHLQRHPSCTSLKQWKGGTVKIDPLALVQAIERYLVVRGYARIRDKDSGESDEDNSEEDIDDTLAAVVITHGARHKLQFLIGDHPLPYNMTVYQAIRQFSCVGHGENGGQGHGGCETESESEAPLGSASVWVSRGQRPREDIIIIIRYLFPSSTVFDFHHSRALMVVLLSLFSGAPKRLLHLCCVACVVACPSLSYLSMPLIGWAMRDNTSYLGAGST